MSHWHCTLTLHRRYQQLQPDFSEYQVRAYYEIHREGSSGALDSSHNPDTFVIPRTARWITGLWIGSLVLALFVSLNAILAQQWIEEYNSRMGSTAASNRRWAWRQMYFTQGAENWKLDLFIASLPLLLHISLLLFFIGLVIFWSPMDDLVAGLLIVVTVFGILFYLGTTLAPLIWPNCPTATPLLSRIHRLWRLTRSKLFLSPSNAPDDHAYDAIGIDALVPVKNGPRLDAEALHWMLKALPASGEVDVALDAIGSLTTKHQEHFSRTSMKARKERFYSLPQPRENHQNELYSAVCTALRVRLRELSSYGLTANGADIGRVLRTAAFMNLDSKSLNRKVLTSWTEQHGQTHDIHLLAQCLGEKSVSDVLAPLIPHIIDWYLSSSQDQEHEDAPTTGPYLESTMELILAYGARRKDAIYTIGREIYQPVVLLCSQILALPRGAAPRPSHATPTTALSILENTVQRAFTSSPPPTRAQTVSKFDPRVDGKFEARASYVLGYILTHIEPNVFHFKQMDATVIELINKAYRGVLSVGGHSQVAFTLKETQRVLALLAVSTFLDQKWTPAEIGDASLLFSQAVRRAAQEESERLAKAHGTDSDIASISSEEAAASQGWSQELTAIQRNMLRVTLVHPESTPGSTTESEIGTVVADCVGSFPSSCEAVAKRYAIYGTLDDVMVRSRMQLLSPHADRDEHTSEGDSVWSLALHAGKRHQVEHHVAPLAREMIVSLNTLQLRGWDVSKQVNEYLRPPSSSASHSSEQIGGPSFDMLFSDVDASDAYDIARHIRVMHPSWWDATAQKLQGLQEDEWTWDPKLKALPARQAFIDRVNSAPQCGECIAHNPMPVIEEEPLRPLTPLLSLQEAPLPTPPSLEDTPAPTPHPSLPHISPQPLPPPTVEIPTAPSISSAPSPSTDEEYIPPPRPRPRPGRAPQSRQNADESMYHSVSEGT